MKKWRVWGRVRAHQYLGVFEARSRKEAEDMAMQVFDPEPFTQIDGCDDAWLDSEHVVGVAEE